MRRVYVGLSGGVDSAVSAAILNDRGYDVTGVFIKIWQPEFIECTWKEDRLEAMRVCVALGIPFEEIDLSDEYQKEVVRPMIEDYTAGITPNPDVLCNEKIKFGSFAAWALQNGADFIATGHYARVEKNGTSFRLLRGGDFGKDQSYFLYRISQKELSRVIFPIGELHKSEVRALAKKYDLPNAMRPDSQGLCFVGDITMDEFLARYVPLKEGLIYDSRKSRVGTHRGAALYTIGQRHGFETSGTAKQFVTEIDVRENVLHVSDNADEAKKKATSLRNVHWITGEPTFPLRSLAQARYRETPFEVSVEKNGLVHFFSPHLTSPGQSLVFYKDDECIGGGIIA